MATWVGSARLAGPAATAVARVSRAAVTLGVLGLASSVFVVVRLLESWRVTPGPASHHISILGHSLSYPAANLAAVAVLALATLGLIVIARTVLETGRELRAARRFARRLSLERLAPLGDGFVIEDPRPRAFCAGLFHPRVYVSRAALEVLDEAALNAVVAHERHHSRRHDPLRLAAGRVITRALFFVPGLPQLMRCQHALSELSADENAVSASAGGRPALARAMLRFSDASESGAAIGIDATRVDYLLGEPLGRSFPALLCIAAVSMIVLVIAVAALAGQVAVGSATLAPPFLSTQPCVVVLAIIPAAVGVIAVRAGCRLASVR